MGYWLKNFVFGSRGADELSGSGRRDVIFGFSGDDIIASSTGTDKIFGGRGFDTVTYTGGIDDYELDIRGNGGRVRVEGENGLDLLYNVEALYFGADDYTLLVDGTNNAVLAGDDAFETGENEALTLSADALLANDREFDGDTLSITSVDATSAAGASVSLNDGTISYEPGSLFDYLAEGETLTDSFTYIVDDGFGGTDVAVVEITITGSNDAPVLSLASEVTIDENTTEVATATAADLDSASIGFSINGGADAAFFEIDPETGVLSFVTAPDFETPEDSDSDNLYEVTVTVTDDLGATADQSVTVTVADVVEQAPITPRINEFHYDNAGGDVGEFIEIRVAAGSDVSGLSVEQYNGSNGALYRTETLDGLTGVTDGDYDYYVIDLPTNGLQNGSPDGIALIEDGAVVEFLSYEGELTATGGTAVGLTSDDIGVSEPGDTPIGQSLQRNEDGTWRSPEAETPGAVNEAADVPSSARINEFHYDNAGSDVGEFVEIRILAGEDVAGVGIDLYNGNGGGVYNTVELATLTPESDGTYDYYVWEVTGTSFQNGSPDGIALRNGAEVLEFLSYEGTLTATDGAAAGLTSTDVGVEETGTTEIGASLQRDADGVWQGPVDETPGAENVTEVIVPAIAAKIHEIQGSGDATDLSGTIVSVSAVVTFVTDTGFYLQEEDADVDGDALTSEGIFVFTGGGEAVTLGDLVTVEGEVSEFFDLTQISSVTSVVIEPDVVDLPTATAISLSPIADPNYEAVEGMLVTVSSGTEDPLTVIENFNFDRFGEIVISAGTQTQPTQLFDAQTEADEIAALIEANTNSRLAIDDGVSGSNPDAFGYVPGGPGDDGNGFLDAGDDFSDDGSTFRLGTELSGDVTGVMSYSFGEFKLLPTAVLDINEETNSGAREDAPDDVGGDLQVASVNVLNYFSTIDGTGTSGPNGLDPRGADSEFELERQTEKLVANITGTGAEVVALQEIENNGFGDESAIQTLVDALNVEATATGSGAVYAAVDPTTDAGFVGTDAIMAAIIYDSSAVTLTHADFIVFEEASAAETFDLASVLNPVVGSGDQVGDFARNRPTVAATFEDNETGESFTVTSSHFKSKGDSNLQDLAEAAQDYLDAGGSAITQADIDALIADPNYDQGDGQAFWNAVRLDGATELAEWISTIYNDGGVEDYLLLGDLNAYAQEDPVQELRDNGLTDVIEEFIGQEEAYSFVFDGQQGTLDQGFASSGLADNLTGATEWHIAADEPDLLNYDNSFKNDAFYNPGVYASSDHDPLIVGLQFGDEFIF